MTSTQIYLIERLIKATFYEIMGVIKRSGLSFGVVSPSREIIESSIVHGAKYTYNDEGGDLNSALDQAILELSPNQAILIIMPDLPFFSIDCLKRVTSCAKGVEIIIVPSISGSGEKKGTAMLFMNSPNLIPFQYGAESNDRFLQTAKEKGLTYKILDLDPCARDLDTSADVDYLHRNLSKVNGSLVHLKVLEKVFREMK